MRKREEEIWSGDDDADTSSAKDENLEYVVPLDVMQVVMGTHDGDKGW